MENDEQEQEGEDWSDDEDDDEDEEEDEVVAPGWELRQAALEGQIERVRELLDQGVHVDAMDEIGWTALIEASDRGHAEVVKLLLSRQAQVDAQGNGGSTALMRATYRGHVEIVKLLEAAGADIHHKDNDGCNALILAAAYDRLPVCLFLLSKGADLMAADNNNWTALTHYGRWVNQLVAPPLSPATLAERRTALEEAWRAGPHPSQVQRRRDEAWDRRKSLMQVSAENGYRPLAHRVAAMPAVDPAAAIPAIPLDNAEQRHAHLLGQVLANEGIHRLIVSML